VLRRLANFAALLLLTARLHAAQPAPPQLEISADRNEIDFSTGEQVLIGHARIGDGPVLLTADEIRYNFTTQVAVATGHVTLTRGPQRLLADKLTYDRRATAFTADSVRVGSHPLLRRRRRRGREPQGNHRHRCHGHLPRTRPLAAHGPVESHPLRPGQNLRSENSRFGLGSAQPFPLPASSRISTNRSSPTSLSTAAIARPSALTSRRGFAFPVGADFEVGGDVGLYTARGLMAGPSISYIGENEGRDLHGFFRSGFIRDHGEKLTDILGRPVPINRGYVEWQHLPTPRRRPHPLRSDQLVARLRGRPRFPPPIVLPRSDARCLHRIGLCGNDYFFSSSPASSPTPSTTSGTLAELRYDLLPMALGHGIYQSAQASVVSLRERPPPASARAW